MRRRCAIEQLLITGAIIRVLGGMVQPERCSSALTRREPAQRTDSEYKTYKRRTGERYAVDLATQPIHPVKLGKTICTAVSTVLQYQVQSLSCDRYAFLYMHACVRAVLMSRHAWARQTECAGGHSIPAVNQQGFDPVPPLREACLQQPAQQELNNTRSTPHAPTSLFAPLYSCCCSRPCPLLS